MLRVAIIACLAAVVFGAEPFRVIFQWNTIDYTWASPAARVQAVERGEYIEANNAIAGIKIWKTRMFLTIPRWKPGVPVTLATTSAEPVNGIANPNLEPYPNWYMQTAGDCNAFQFVQSMEIDPLGRMWLLDTGRTETMNLVPMNRCTPRLVILNLEDNGAVLRSYPFPRDVANPSTAYLNDIVLDHHDGGLAYITDTGKEDPGIIVYSLRNNTSWKVRHESMKAQFDAVNFMVAGTRVNSSINVDGIALSPASTHGAGRQLYYSPLSSFNLYSVPVSALKNQSSPTIAPYVQDLGRKISQTDGMVMANNGILYFGLLADDAIAMWDTRQGTSVNNGQTTISRSHELMQWPDTFAFDENGYLWCVANSLQNFITNRINVNQPNYRVVRSLIHAKNYQYLEDGSSPLLPVITAGSDRLTMAFSSCLALVLLILAR